MSTITRFKNRVIVLDLKINNINSNEDSMKFTFLNHCQSHSDRL